MKITLKDGSFKEYEGSMSVLDITKDISEGLANAIGESVRDERMKANMITNISHDIKTPLTSIIGYLELLAGNTQIPQEMQHKYIEIAYSKSRRLDLL